MGVHAFSAWGEIERYIHLAATTQPDMERHAKYRQLFELYRSVYEVNRQNFDRLARIEGMTAE
jgi:sugar (pentulose or hexulose) kinase